jgi:5'-nucleotidase
LIANFKEGRLLPLGYGVSVNIPYITSFTNNACINPPFIQTRMTGGADVDSAFYNASMGLFTYKNVVPADTNKCINGDCSLPGETKILSNGHQSSVSIFTVDYGRRFSATSSPIQVVGNRVGSTEIQLIAAALAVAFAFMTL